MTTPSWLRGKVEAYYLLLYYMGLTLVDVSDEVDDAHNVPLLRAGHGLLESLEDQELERHQLPALHLADQRRDELARAQHHVTCRQSRFS